MNVNLQRIDPQTLNARQKENYNFQKVSAVLADFGFATLGLSDDWQSADFIAQHLDGVTFLKVQLIGRLTFAKAYLGKGLLIAFPYKGDWYLYPHDELFDRVQVVLDIQATGSWTMTGRYHFPSLSKKIEKPLGEYRLGSAREGPAAAVVSQ